MLLFLALLQAASLPGDVSVMSFNIRYGTAADGAHAWPHRQAQVIEVIQRHDPDILGLQEALDFQLREIEARLPAYGRIGVGREDGLNQGEFSAILYRRRRNLHLDHESAPSRERSAELLARRIEERNTLDPVLVMGDFNAGEDQAPVRYLLTNVPLVDPFRKLYPDATGVATYHAFTGRTEGARIDYVLASAEWSIRSSGIDRSNDAGRYPSDHFPVHAVLRLDAR